MRMSLAGVVVSVLLSGVAVAQEPLTARLVPTDAEALAQAEQFRQLKVSPRKVRSGVRKLTRELRWHSKLDAAVAQGEQLGRPIVWIQALGNLKGFT